MRSWLQLSETIEQGARGRIPGELRGPLERHRASVIATAGLGQQAADGLGDGVDIGRIEKEPAAPTTSGNDPARLAITGVPQAIASMAGRPNPSSNEGWTRA